MTISEQIKILESIVTINQLEENYTIANIKEMLKNIKSLTQTNNEFFMTYMNQSNIEPQRVKNMWIMKDKLMTLENLLMKGLLTLERQEIIGKAQQLTHNLVVLTHPDININS